jgi:ribonuclease E
MLILNFVNLQANLIWLGVINSMKKRMLIDAEYLEETRVVVTNDNEIEDFDHETTTKKQNRGNLYLAKIARVEPSLQAAFVDYGNERHGFLAFSEIHPDYFQIPIADKEDILKEGVSSLDDQIDSEIDLELDNSNVSENKPSLKKLKFYHKYRIQEVIKKGQILLVQVAKEERGNKGAALTTFISLAGRYCVLMTNTIRKGGISRRITHSNDRKKLRSIIENLNIPNNMAVIVRTAGSKRTKIEIKRDYNFLNKTWEKIKSNTLKSVAPVLIHEENNIIKRGIRDLYTPEIEEILIQGDTAFKAAKNYMKTLIPSKTKILKEYSDKTPLLQKYNIDKKLEKIHNPIATLKSGGYIVINQTEALVAVDVNSGKATKERNIEETALQTNKEAAEELAIQLRLRDLSGLIVIDFIDMLLSKNNRIIENILKQRLHSDRAKIQVGNISSFGLLEMSRQRLRPSIYEADFITCHHCLGHGRIRSLESLTLKALHHIEEKATNYNEKSLEINIPEETAIHILNNKRKELSNIEEKRNIIINIIPDQTLKNEEDPVEQINNINKANNDTKISNRDKNKKEPNPRNNNKIKRPTSKNKFIKRPIQNKKLLNPIKNIAIENTEINSTNSITKNKNKITKNITEQKPKKKITKKPIKQIDKKTSIIKSEIPESKKQKIKAVNPKKKSPVKKGWWNKNDL